MPPTRRRSASPSAEDLASLAETPIVGGRLRKAPNSDPVLGVAGTPATHPDSADSFAAPSRRTPKPPSKTKVGFYQAPEDAARARAAYDWTRPHEGHRSFSDFISSAVMREVERLEEKYQDGQPWPALEPGELPTGKPLGSKA